MNKAYATHAADKPLEPFSFERRPVGRQDVGIAIKFCGICHSDIHTARSEWGPSRYPCVPGHEIVGVVEQIGDEVKKFKVGDIVGVGCMVGSCKSCGSCHDHDEQYCENGFVGTYNSPVEYEGGHTKGGYSQYMVVDQDFVLNVPANLDLAAVAPLLCAGITTYSPLRRCGVGQGHRVAVMGLGGLGHMGVKLAASFGAEVTVLSRSPHKQADAERLGAKQFLLTTDEDAVAKHALYFDFVLDTVSAKHDLNIPLGMLKRDGTLIMVGAADEPLDLNVFPLILQRRSMMGSLIGGIKETQEMLDHCGKHNIVSDIELIPAARINEAYERTLKSDVKYRFVIDCATL